MACSSGDIENRWGDKLGRLFECFTAEANTAKASLLSSCNLPLTIASDNKQEESYSTLKHVVVHPNY